MSLDIQLEQLYERIELVSGMGSPRRGKLCIMSLVAFLSGDRHTDEPRTASSLIRLFAIPLNDGMDGATRQRLKPFAPRIIGTADRRDAERAELLFTAMYEEVLPEALKDRHPFFARAGAGKDAKAVESLYALLRQIKSGERKHVREMLEQVDGGDATLFEALWRVAKAYRSGMYNSMAETAASLLVGLAQAAPTAERTNWYWNKAIDLLDRMCDVGAEDRVPEIRLDRVAALQNAPDNRYRGASAVYRRLMANLKGAKSADPVG
jgi:hypothetical protein